MRHFLSREYGPVLSKALTNQPLAGFWGELTLPVECSKQTTKMTSNAFKYMCSQIFNCVIWRGFGEWQSRSYLLIPSVIMRIRKQCDAPFSLVHALSYYLVRVISLTGGQLHMTQDCRNVMSCDVRTHRSATQ